MHCQGNTDRFGFMHFLHAALPEMLFLTQSAGSETWLPLEQDLSPQGQGPGRAHGTCTAVSTGTVPPAALPSAIFPNQKHSGMVLHLALKLMHRFPDMCI